MSAVHWKDVSAGDIIQTNHGRGPLRVDHISIGASNVVTITGAYVDGSGHGKKRVPDNGMVDRISIRMGIHQITPPEPKVKKQKVPKPKPPPKVRPRGKSAAGLNIREGRWIA
jgi:hypothetical protein